MALGLDRFDFLLVLLFLVTIISAVDLDSITNCYMRKFKLHASKPFRMRNGIVLPCEDLIPVFSCWGRCDSSEIGDYRVPYKLTNHSVCTYGGRKIRTVRLRHCHPQHPDPTYTVFDATHCVCDTCDPYSTSCENLNG